MAVTPTTTTMKTGTKPTSGYMLAGFRATTPPFIVKKTIETTNAQQAYRAVAKKSIISNAYQLNQVTEPVEDPRVKEYRTPYIHTYFPVYSGATAVTRCENILLTYIFHDDTPLFYQWTVIDEDEELVVFSLTNDFPEQVSFTVDDQPYSNYTIMQNLDGSMSLYTDKRMRNMKLTIQGVSYFPNPYPVMKWISSYLSFTADGAGAEPHEWAMVQGNIYVNVASQAQEWAIGYAENFDFLQEGFPIIGVDFIDWHTRWRLMVSAGSFVVQNSGNTDIYEIGTSSGTTSMATRVHYGVELERINKLTYVIGDGIDAVRTIIGVYQENGTAVTLASKDPLNAKVVLTTETQEKLFVDYTTIDRYNVSEYNLNYGPSYDSNYYTNGLAKKDLTTSVWIRPAKDIVNQVPTTKGEAHYTALGVLDDANIAGTFSGTQDASYIATIDSLGVTEDTFEWSDNGGITYTTKVNCATTAVALSNGVTISWLAKTGHSLDDSWTWTEYAGTEDVIITTSNETNKYVDESGTLKVLDSSYILLAEIDFPNPVNEVEKIIFRGQTGDLFKLQDYDPREYPVASLEFNNIDVLDINADPATRTITIQVPNDILSYSTRTEVENEIRKFIPLGTQLIVNFKA